MTGELGERTTLLARLTAAATAAALLAGVSPARADGIKCRAEVDLLGLVKQARTIVLVEVTAADPEYGEREAYGEKVRYVERYRFEARRVRVVRGTASAIPERLQFSLDGGPVPGKWVLIERCYARTIDMEQVKPGARLLVFGEQEQAEPDPGEAGPAVLMAMEADDARLLPAVERALRAAKPPARQRPRSP